MEVIPVIDLLNGCVVHAKRGQRSQYRPIRTPLCDSSEPLTVVKALLGLYPFRRLYIADLEAIQGRGSHTPAIHEIQQRYPELDIWLDDGLRSVQELRNRQTGRLRSVLGSENLRSGAHFQEMKHSAGQDIILSLDFGIAGHMGPAELLDMPSEWTDELIVMTLARVGSSEGPDLETLSFILSSARAVNPASRVYAAGGVRHMADLNSLNEMGVTGALVATALHDGSLTLEEIALLEAG